MLVLITQGNTSKLLEHPLFLVKTKNDKKYITIKVKVIVREEDFKDTPNKKIKDKDAKMLYPSIVKWYKERLSYLPYIKVDSTVYPYINITVLEEDYNYIGKSSIIEPDSDGNYPLKYKKKQYEILGSAA